MSESMGLCIDHRIAWEKIAKNSSEMLSLGVEPSLPHAPTSKLRELSSLIATWRFTSNTYLGLSPIQRIVRCEE